MEAATPKTATSASDFDPLIKKVDNEDPDIRFMVLGDMQSMLSHSIPSLLKNDTKRMSQLMAAVVDRLDDANGDVQSQALKTVAPLTRKLTDMMLRTFLDVLVSAKTKNSLDDAVYITAVQTVITSMPRPNTTPSMKLVGEALDTISVTVLPKLSDTLLESSEMGGTKPESIDLAHQLVVCYGTVLPEKDKRHIMNKLLALLDDDRASIIVHKRAVTALAALSPYLPDQLLRNELIANLAQRLEAAELTSRPMRMFLLLVGSIAQASRGRLDASLPQLVPHVLKATSEENFEELSAAALEGASNIQGEEVVEAALGTLEELLSSCAQAMKKHTGEAITAGSRFLSYDPNLIESEDGAAMDEDDTDDFGEDEDFEDDGEMSDSDDGSWKLRRCSAKVLHTIIRTRAGTDLLQNGVLYERIAPVLVKRLNEREESVRLEVIDSLARLVKLTGELASPSEYIPHPSPDKIASRKRRRSSAAAFPAKHQNLARGATSPRETPSPTHGPSGDLAKISTGIAQAALGLLKQKLITSQQAAASLLRDLVSARHGRLENLLEPVVEATVRIATTVDASQSGSSALAGSAAAATGASLRIEAFRLLSAICDTHSSKALAAQASAMSDAAMAAIKDSQFKVATEAIFTSESIIKVLTPPRSLGATDKAREIIPRLFEVLATQVQNQSIELETRTTAIHALGFLLARTAGQSQLLAGKDRAAACTILEDRLKNEVTRVWAIEAVECIASAGMGKNDYPTEWIRAIGVELGNQLRKADRKLSSTSLHTLSVLLSSDAVTEALDEQTGKSLVVLLLPVLTSKATNQLPLASACISRIVQSHGDRSVDVELVDAVVGLALEPLSGNILEAYLEVVDVLGSSAVANTLLERFLKEVGISGSPEVNGAAIGTLMAAGGDKLDIKYDDIIAEMQSTEDAKRKMLALSVLGYYGFRMGASSPLQPDAFLGVLDEKAEVARTAAVALGRAGAGDPAKYLPLILESIRGAGKKQATLIPALREALSHRSQATTNVAAQTKELWDVLIELSGLEGGRVVAAECVGRLVAMLPEKYVPLLQEQLHATSADARGLVNEALRYALADSDGSLDEALRPVIGDMLTTLLRDGSIENRRLALMTLSSAISNKPGLVTPHIPLLSQVVMERAHVDTSLIHEVSMGPFKHKVDDGLEMRKSAYDTLHTLINAAYLRLDSASVFERVVAGLGDEGDIKALCTLLVGKLLTIDRAQSARHLHEYASMFAATLSAKLRDTAVKQEIERARESSKDMLRATVKINQAFPPGTQGGVDPAIWQNWQAYLASVRKEHATAMSQVEEELGAAER